MSWLIYAFISLATFLIMEGITWLTHKYVMHGFLWYLHKDHHQPTKKFFEKNDFFFLIFAIPGWLCIQFGCMYKNWWAVSVGVGITMYGVAYFLVHEIIIHQRFKLFTRSNHRYIKAIRWAHKMHHRHLNKEDGESFGMLFIAKKYWDKIKKDSSFQQSIRNTANSKSSAV
jgi:beta-carotene 3-hydroxylase